MYALIEKVNDTLGRVAQIEDEEFDVHPDLSWIEIDDSDTITTSHTYDFINEAFVEPEVVEEEDPPSNDEIVEAVFESNKTITALINSLNDGSFVPGSNHELSALKQIIVDTMDASDQSAS